MSTNPHRRWYAIASLIALAVLLSSGGRMKAYLQSGTQEGAPRTSLSEPVEAPQEEAASPQNGGTAEHQEPAHESESVWGEIFHWFNFLLIVAAIWYLGKKYLGPFLDQRAQAIGEDMERSARAREEAARRLSDVEDKLQRLEEEIGSLRRSASQEAAAEGERIGQRAKADSRKIAAAAEQEIAAAAKAARQELKAYTAELAVGLAEKKIQDSISPQAEKVIFHSFLQNLDDSRGGGGNRGPSGSTAGAAGSGLPPKRGGA